MKVLVISDIHGNYHALKAVMENIQYDVLICSGDLVVDYPFPEECINVLTKSCSYLCMGNNDYAVAYNKKPYDKLPPKYLKYADALDRAKELTLGLLNEESINYLRKLPRECQFLLDGISFYMNHTVPSFSLYHYLDPEASETELEKYYRNIHADILITGHTHIPYIKKLKNKILINPGSVGESRDGDPRPSFATFDTRTWHIELGRVEYDITETSIVLQKLNFPNYSLFCLKNGFLPEDPNAC